jgi:hypothetical protein
MKYTIYKILSLALVVSALQSCADEENYKPLPYEVYVASKVPAGTTAFTNSASAKKTVPGGVFRIYVNQLYDKDVTVSFEISGTAVSAQDFNPPAALSAVIPANSYFAEVNFEVINNPLLTSSRTVVFTLTGASEGFDIGIGAARGYKVFTHTITP